MTGIWLRRVAWALLASVVTLAVLTARAVARGEQEMAASDAAFDAGELRASIDHARSAAVLQAPGAPHVRAAYQRLIAIAVGAEAAGQPEVARAAWSAVRGAALETRHLWTPRSAELRRANRNLARLLAAPEAGGGEPTIQLVSVDAAKRAPWALALGAGFALSAVGLLMLARRAVDGDGRLRLDRARAPALLALAGVACWTIAVLRA